MLKTKDFLQYDHLLEKRNRLIQQYHAANTGKDKTRAIAKLYVMDEDNKTPRGKISC